MKSFLAESYSLAVIDTLVIGVFLQINGLVTLSVTLIWACSLIAVPVAVLMIIASLLYEKSSGKQKENIEEMLRKSVRKRCWLVKAYGWVKVLATLGLLAWAGWVVTAIVYCLAVLIIMLANSILRDEAIKQDIA